ncbi:hypothetical protein CDAR_482271 [Caerostris darwini]|uniref:Uncharacterized protein n=1 Tax=Caerostris darwini TaxID=1538125 RepID=A0AAV4TIT1_9ARAC|nr:hypothetical protein CDAR_482271 [Caerostris darwini]
MVQPYRPRDTAPPIRGSANFDCINCELGPGECLQRLPIGATATRCLFRNLCEGDIKSKRKVISNHIFYKINISTEVEVLLIHLISLISFLRGSLEVLVLVEIAVLEVGCGWSPLPHQQYATVKEDHALTLIVRLHLSSWDNMQIEFFFSKGAEGRVYGKLKQNALNTCHPLLINENETASENGSLNHEPPSIE